jgi:hypothetical protein
VPLIIFVIIESPITEIHEDPPTTLFTPIHEGEVVNGLRFGRSKLTPLPFIIFVAVQG